MRTDRTNVHVARLIGGGPSSGEAAGGEWRIVFAASRELGPPSEGEMDGVCVDSREAFL